MKIVNNLDIGTFCKSFAEYYHLTESQQNELVQRIEAFFMKKTYVCLSSRQLGKTYLSKVCSNIIEKYKAMSIFDIMSYVINNKDIGSNLLRKELTSSINVDSSTIDNYRRLLTVTGYLSDVSRGSYIVNKHIEDNMNVNKLRILAEKDYYLPTRQKAEHFHELRLRLFGYSYDLRIPNFYVEIVIDVIKHKQIVTVDDIHNIYGRFDSVYYEYLIQLGMLTIEGKSNFYEKQ